MHLALIARYGGASGVRDPGALEAALFRPQTGYYEDIVAEAAALFESLAMNHPFVDGNKRVAFASVDVFLRINGWRLNRAPMQIHVEMLGMIERHEFDFSHIEPWLRGFASAAEQIASNATVEAQMTAARRTMRKRRGALRDLAK